MFTRTENNGAVSSVVGVIMMVALTVVLAAVLGQFVFDLASMLNRPPQAGVTFRQSMDTATPGNYQVTVIVNAMPNADRVEIQPSPPPSYSGPALAGMSLSEVGQSQTEPYPTGTFLTVVAYQNGNSVVIQTYTVGN